MHNEVQVRSADHGVRLDDKLLFYMQELQGSQGWGTFVRVVSARVQENTGVISPPTLVLIGLLHNVHIKEYVVFTLYDRQFYPTTPTSITLSTVYS